MSSKAFAQIIFSDEIQNEFSGLVTQMVEDSQLYYSDVVAHIQGNMCKSLHCTIAFGLKDTDVSNPEVLDIINNAKIKKLKLGNLFFIPGYLNLYKVLCIEVLDENGELLNLNKALTKFVEDEKLKRRRFEPHLSLAYVQQEFVMPESLPEFPHEITIQNIELMTVDDFNSQVQSN